MGRLHALCSVLVVALVVTVSPMAQGTDSIEELLAKNQSDLTKEGRAFLVNEARRTSFFLLGGIHGDNETPALVADLWMALQPMGYRFIDVELSPWTVAHLPTSGSLRGGDIEEAQPHMLIRDLATANPQNSQLQSMVELTKDGYRRRLAPDLLQRFQTAGELKDSPVGGISERMLLLSTLQVEAERLTEPMASSVNVNAMLMKSPRARARQPPASLK